MCETVNEKPNNAIPNVGRAIPKAPDPWAGRGVKMRCLSCMWFVEKREAVGRCRRHAPTMSGYPVVFNTDWCGDHKLNEEVVT
ncbi:hypothetical protein Dform_00855 [Dehalogenimonas formicexedens]|uniref:Uncharacterized protein n=1 Tax=Dehalogenimonas formicexedens TaxID=1839801 RepID=A0A1P8F6Y9_9CHLR|nr:hypothetical protein Dform_00855 [Dehalogenimonas formicexedens]